MLLSVIFSYKLQKNSYSTANSFLNNSPEKLRQISLKYSHDGYLNSDIQCIVVHSTNFFKFWHLASSLWEMPLRMLYAFLCNISWVDHFLAFMAWEETSWEAIILQFSREQNGQAVSSFFTQRALHPSLSWATGGLQGKFLIMRDKGHCIMLF